MKISKLDVKDVKILRLLQQNCRFSAAEIAKKIRIPVTTVYAKMNKMEKLGLIKEYKAVLDAKKLGLATTVIILISFTYHPAGEEKILSQRTVAQKIAKFPEVQEVQIVTGDWDLMIKIKCKDVEEVGNFVVDRLRPIKGVERTSTCMVLDTTKETLDVNV